MTDQLNEDTIIHFPIGNRDAKRNSNSDSTKKKEIAHKIEIEDRNYENTYSTCCSERGTDKRLLHYATKFTLSILVLGFCFYRLAVDQQCDPNTPVYVGFITMIVTAYIGDKTRNKNDL